MTGAFWPVADLLAHLAGRWRVERTVRDLASGAEGRFTGTTVFSALDGGGLLHEESGTFTWQGVARPAPPPRGVMPGPTPPPRGGGGGEARGRPESGPLARGGG
ncbi:DUF6314 family protein, partial [Streptomyces tricolor]